MQVTRSTRPGFRQRGNRLIEVIQPQLLAGVGHCKNLEVMTPAAHFEDRQLRRYLFVTVVGIGILCALAWYGWSSRQSRMADEPLFIQIVSDHARLVQEPPVALPDEPPKIRALLAVRLLWADAAQNIHAALERHPVASSDAQARVEELQSLAQSIVDLVDPLLADSSALEARDWSTLVQEIRDLEEQFDQKLSTLQR